MGKKSLIRSIILIMFPVLMISGISVMAASHDITCGHKGEITGLIKATAIVGYIAVQDLTKAGDIIRSRTYEAFFPLIAIAIFYFALEGLFGVIVEQIRRKTDRRERKRGE
ncbi:MAG: hypothetical protein K5770_04900 [Lachnospiraceae bacterium]|nr:hypothetical protein [Lachnospiraceae bacterium]